MVGCACGETTPWRWPEHVCMWVMPEACSCGQSYSERSPAVIAVLVVVAAASSIIAVAQSIAYDVSHKTSLLQLTAIVVAIVVAVVVAIVVAIVVPVAAPAARK